MAAENVKSPLRQLISLLSLHVVAMDKVLIAKVELAIADDRMRPDSAARATGFDLRLKFETPMLLPAFRRCLHERNSSASLFKTVQHPTGATDRALSERAGIPHFRARQEILAEPARIGVAVKVIAHQNNSAMMIFHQRVLVHGGD